MSAPESAAAERPITIRFHGLFLFVKPKQKDELHVFCAQPAPMTGMDMKHVTTVRHDQRGSGAAAKWKGERMPDTFEQDWQGSNGGSLKMPPATLVSSLNSMYPTVKAPALATAVANNRSANGARLILRGGTLAPAKGEEIGVWHLPSNPQVGNLYFPYVMEWTGVAKVPERFKGGQIEIWHALAKESPTKPKEPDGDWDDPQKPNLGCSEAGEIGASHFQAYHLIFGQQPSDVTFTCDVIHPYGGAASPERGEAGKLRVTRGPGHLKLETILVASCPSVTGETDP